MISRNPWRLPSLKEFPTEMNVMGTPVATPTVYCVSRLASVPGLARKLRISTIIKSLQSERSSIRDVGPEFGQESSHIRLVGKFRDKPRNSKLISGLSSRRGRNVV